jgi:hypothetical protein
MEDSFMPLDRIDIKILRALQAEERLTNAEAQLDRTQPRRPSCSFFVAR